ncbi:hypothetical protein MON38_04025 [Hymenobacter sp. DH14]|uniref:Uncharacterized protein n=1 Tax=Hymenobacter cyanobacteriorum TaxID=2926463 RepID=A0A9X1VEE7_9BACT|nr:hypothetical protein [Hymenobacter cyanobacteriorum]MCI1186573.1 hypothetical protein [Hymenobacter cyanobacteriorum]
MGSFIGLFLYLTPIAPLLIHVTAPDLLFTLSIAGLVGLIALVASVVMAPLAYVAFQQLLRSFLLAPACCAIANGVAHFSDWCYLAASVAEVGLRREAGAWQDSRADSRNRNKGRHGCHTSRRSAIFSLTINALKQRFRKSGTSHFGNKKSQKYNQYLRKPFIISKP